jgi:hypothetical protein
MPQTLLFLWRNKLTSFEYFVKRGKNTLMCYERTRDQGTLGSIAIAIVEPLGGHLLCISCWSRKEPPRGGSAPTGIT